MRSIQALARLELIDNSNFSELETSPPRSRLFATGICENFPVIPVNPIWTESLGSPGKTCGTFCALFVYGYANEFQASTY